MPQYFLSLPHDSASEPTMEAMAEMDPAELDRVMAEVEALNTGLKDAGAFVHAGGLHPPSTAVTVDSTTGEAVHTEGPFVEADSYVGGFWIIEAPDQDSALEWADKASRALQSRVEVREVQ